MLPVDRPLQGERLRTIHTDSRLPMIPPLVRRCPECRHVTWSRRFTAVDDGEGGSRLVECPACGHRFSTVDAPWLQ
ncbi:hypothetical protein ACODNH_07430 [Haloarcula sp. NS06]|uniref:hypothetical protein n=1 Tax=unclassified Haloarcula TaxID=2624677 RepID=UPI0027AF7330|nr:hypothetical protein [Haloarcula sp. H-GB4]MDQ2073248.1 hypothetical protein [Haloarcula sp. H-GB4]